MRPVEPRSRRLTSSAPCSQETSAHGRLRVSPEAIETPGRPAIDEHPENSSSEIDCAGRSTVTMSPLVSEECVSLLVEFARLVDLRSIGLRRYTRSDHRVAPVSPTRTERSAARVRLRPHRQAVRRIASPHAIPTIASRAMDADRAAPGDSWPSASSLAPRLIDVDRAARGNDSPGPPRHPTTVRASARSRLRRRGGNTAPPPNPAPTRPRRPRRRRAPRLDSVHVTHEWTGFGRGACRSILPAWRRQRSQPSPHGHSKSPNMPALRYQALPYASPLKRRSLSVRLV